MKPRHPTPHELKLWRASNRFTQKKTPEEPLEDEVEEQVRPSPNRGEVRRGAESGKASSSPKAPHPTSPLLGEELRPLASRMAKRRFATHAEIDATLDLHGLSKLEAYAKVKSFVARQYKAGKRHLLIITGKGRMGEGILRTELPHWLNEPALRPMISAFSHGRPEKGGNGVTHVLVKKYRD